MSPYIPLWQRFVVIQVLVDSQSLTSSDSAPRGSGSRRALHCVAHRVHNTQDEIVAHRGVKNQVVGRTGTVAMLQADALQAMVRHAWLDLAVLLDVARGPGFDTTDPTPVPCELTFVSDLQETACISDGLTLKAQQCKAFGEAHNALLQWITNILASQQTLINRRASLQKASQRLSVWDQAYTSHRFASLRRGVMDRILLGAH